MTSGELAYLVLVLAGFFTFVITLATIAHQTNGGGAGVRLPTRRISNNHSTKRHKSNVRSSSIKKRG